MGDLSVALRKESVDRNKQAQQDIALDNGSLSARRAWIEIVRGVSLLRKITVALRKESVDRNGCWLPMHSWWLVALRKESVDRNTTG